MQSTLNAIHFVPIGRTYIVIYITNQLLVRGAPLDNQGGGGGGGLGLFLEIVCFQFCQKKIV